MGNKIQKKWNGSVIEGSRETTKGVGGCQILGETVSHTSSLSLRHNLRETERGRSYESRRFQRSTRVNPIADRSRAFEQDV